MKLIDKVQDALAQDENFNPFERAMAIGSMKRDEETANAFHASAEIIKPFIGRRVGIEDIIVDLEDVKIFKVANKSYEENPYSFIIKVNDEWRGGNQYGVTFDEVLLLYLQVKHIGYNSDFANFAKKMLEF